MNKQELITRLTELSGMAEAIYAISDCNKVCSIAGRIGESLYDLVSELSDDEECPGCEHYHE